MSEDEIRAAAASSKEIEPMKTTEQGAANSVWCAVSSHLDGKGGVYCEDVDVAQAVPADFPQPRGVRPWAMDPALADRLWTMSEEWCGLRAA
jgi:hypothetical protein